jgi:DNA-binding GntR family transcriptional regulator
MPYANESDVATTTLIDLCDRFGISRTTLRRLLNREGIEIRPDADEPKVAAIAARDVARVREARRRSLKHWGGRQFYLPPD